MSLSCARCQKFPVAKSSELNDGRVQVSFGCRKLSFTLWRYSLENPQNSSLQQSQLNPRQADRLCPEFSSPATLSSQLGSSDRTSEPSQSCSGAHPHCDILTKFPLNFLSRQPHALCMRILNESEYRKYFFHFHSADIHRSCRRSSRTWCSPSRASMSVPSTCATINSAPFIWIT
jgi:hypothetical protein